MSISKKIKPFNILMLFVALNLIIGLIIVSDFGKSTDENSESRRSGIALNFYSEKWINNPEETYEKLGHTRYYGTASTTLIHFVERFFFPNTNHDTKVVAHYCYFVFFQASVIALFFLGKHFFNGWISLVIALLFGTQPLLFGHAFMNPKDIPLLTTFLFTIVAGFTMVDQWLQRASRTQKNNEDRIEEIPYIRNQKKKQIFVILFILLLFIALWFNNMILNLIMSFVQKSYSAQGSSLLGKLFASMTTQGNLDGYLSLTRLLFFRVLRWLVFAVPFFLLLIFQYVKRNRLFGGYIEFFTLLAAAIWGFAVSTRVLAVAAGGIVGLYALINLKKKAVFPLAFYTITASIFSYITWPLLWFYGFRVYLASLDLFNDFPWQGEVLFEGQLFDPTDMPARYIPKLMALQFTEPLVVLSVAGFFISLFLLFKKKINVSKMLLMYAWFFVPLIYVMISGATVYNNFRQFLFITPPLFIFSGITLQQIASRIKNSWFLVMSILVMALALVSIVQIHPFQYNYYNGFIGGIGGAYQKYQLDYYGLAYKDAMDYVNENVSAGSKIIVWKDNLLGQIYAEKEYIFKSHYELSEDQMKDFDYAIMPVDHYDEWEILKNSPVVFTVERETASFLVVLAIGGDNN